MPVLVVGSVALDSVETPFGKADDVLGGSATFFSAAASLLTPVQLVGVVGTDYPMEKLESLAARGVDLAGLERADGPSFRWRGRYHHDLNSAETLETHLGVFSRFSPKIPEQFRQAPYVFLANIDPRLQLDVLNQVDRPKPFACGFIGYLARTGDFSEGNMRRAVMYGSALGSFAVEKFSIDRLMEIGRPEIDARVRQLRELVTFEEELPS